jgi:hypothetical protein
MIAADDLPEHLRQPDGTCRCGASKATDAQVLAHVTHLRLPALSCACGRPREAGRGSCPVCAVRDALAASCAACEDPVPSGRWAYCDPCTFAGARTAARWHRPQLSTTGRLTRGRWAA